MDPLDLFHYADYRNFLRDWLLAARRRRGFSYRSFAQRAGLGSSGHLKMVIDGKRNLGLKALERFMNGMKLEGRERIYFRNLVLFNQSKDGGEKARYEGKLALLRKCRSVVPHVLQKIAVLRGEILVLLGSDFSAEEASLLADEMLSLE